MFVENIVEADSILLFHLHHRFVATRCLLQSVNAPHQRIQSVFQVRYVHCKPQHRYNSTDKSLHVNGGICRISTHQLNDNFAKH